MVVLTPHAQVYNKNFVYTYCMYLPLTLERFGKNQTHMLDAVIVCSVPPFEFLVLGSVGLTESSPNANSSTNIHR